MKKRNLFGIDKGDPKIVAWENQLRILGDSFSLEYLRGYIEGLRAGDVLTKDEYDHLQLFLRTLGRRE